jgi:hypothetical protein
VLTALDVGSTAPASRVRSAHTVTDPRPAPARIHPASAVTAEVTGPRPAAEVGGAVWADIERAGDHLVLRLDGTLSRSTAPQVATLLDTVLAEGQPVLVELARLRLGWASGLEVFPMAQRAGGGWPVARLVLFAADEELALALQAAGIGERVPMAPDRRTATTLRNQRPEAVHRQVNLLNSSASARSARHAAETACRDWNIPHLAPVAALIAEELVTNAVEHTDGTAELTLGLRGSDVTVGVRDGSAGSVPRPRLSSVDRPCGRGLHLVAAFADRWGVARHGDGKTVWAELSIHRPPHEHRTRRSPTPPLDDVEPPVPTGAPRGPG